MDCLVPVINYVGIYKGLLQEHCRKMGLCDPIYVTDVKEGSEDHLPYFSSKVSIHRLNFKSDGKCYTKKEAEQAAARVALTEIFKADQKELNLGQMVHESGLCKSMLQEYAHRLRIALPVYEHKKKRNEGFMALYECTVKICGRSYLGLGARTKKCAEKNAAVVACASIMAIITANAAANDIVNAPR